MMKLVFIEFLIIRCVLGIPCFLFACDIFYCADAVEVEEEAEESKWQDRISTGFDRLVAFASTELDKRRRSTEGSDSCNTSPDSGIGHGDPQPPVITMVPGKQDLKHIINNCHCKNC